MPEPWREMRERLWQSAGQILLFSAAAALLAGLIVEGVGETYQVHYSYWVSLSGREEADDFRFDGFYAIQATELFAETLAAWLTAPETIVRAHEAAGLAVMDLNPRGLAERVSAVKKAPQMVEVTVKGKDQKKTEELAAGLRTITMDKIGQYPQDGIPGLRYNAQASNPWTGTVSLSRPIVTGAVFIFVCLLGINLVLLKASWKKSDWETGKDENRD